MLKLYEVKGYARSPYWWTQRNENGNCFEIIKRNENKYSLYMNEDYFIEVFDDFNKAEHALRNLEKNAPRFESDRDLEIAIPRLRIIARQE
jgi:hypothetical protein